MIALGVVTALGIAVAAAISPPGAMQNRHVVGPMVAGLLVWTTLLGLFLRRATLARIDAAGIRADAPRPGYGLGQHFSKTLVPWSEVASYRLIVRLDAFGRPSPGVLVFLDGHGHRRLALGLMSASRRDRERLLSYLRDRFPQKVSGPEEAELMSGRIVPPELYFGGILGIAAGIGIIAAPLVPWLYGLWGLRPPNDLGPLFIIPLMLATAMVEGLFRALGMSQWSRHIESRGRSAAAPSDPSRRGGELEIFYPESGHLIVLVPLALGLMVLVLGFHALGWRGWAVAVLLLILPIGILFRLVGRHFPIPYARADAREIRAYRPLRGWVSARASWDDVASCEIATAYSFAQAATSWATLSDRAGETLLKLNLTPLHPDDRARLLDYLKARLPKTYAGALDE